MNKNTAKARRVLRERTAAHRLAASLRRGRARSIATQVIAAGVAAETAKGVAGGLRSVAKRLGIKPARVVRNDRNDRREGKVRHHYTPAQVAVLRANYKPRKAEYKAAVAQMALAA
jgi:Tfp pilus assembly protein FimT